MLKTLVDHSGKTFKMGRRAPVATGPRLRLANYLRAKLPDPPASVDYSGKASAELEQILCNDRLGCCTASGAFHTAGVFCGNAGRARTWTEAQVIAFYSATTGYVPGNESTDNGGDEETVLNFWQKNGLLGDGSCRIAGHLQVDNCDVAECKAAMWLFESLYFGAPLPDEWINPFPSKSGFIWDTAGAPDEENGHCFVGVGFDDAGIQISTWGMIGTITWSAMAKYCAGNVGGQLFTVLSEDALIKASAKAPNGMNWQQLVADFDVIGGQITPPPSRRLGL